MDGDDLLTWIAGLRVRVARGELADLGPIDVSGATLASVELAARILLADLDHYDDLPLVLRWDPRIVARRGRLLDDLGWLRERIG